MARTTLGLRRNLKEEQRRSDIRQASIKIFSDKGYVSSTMDDIVQEAGCSKSLIYWYWGSKADLFNDLVDICMTRYVEAFEEVVGSRGDYLERLQGVAVTAAGIYEESPELNKLVHFGAITSSSKSKENFRERIFGYKEQILSQIERLLQEGVDESILIEDIDVSAMALHIMSMVEGYIYLSILKERMPLERIFDVLAKYIMPGIIRK
ncbi:MAG: TetR/AcrR family transcriptional regulator [Thermodesulfobacteriota bacterium]|nr:TetR/AcrR family transcriptional regulator [Thermodesulfobacteriota bacterium]